MCSQKRKSWAVWGTSRSSVTSGKFHLICCESEGHKFHNTVLIEASQSYQVGVWCPSLSCHQTRSSVRTWGLLPPPSGSSVSQRPEFKGLSLENWCLVKSRHIGEWKEHGVTHLGSSSDSWVYCMTFKESLCLSEPLLPHLSNGQNNNNKVPLKNCWYGLD